MTEHATPTELAEAGAEAIRALNHATFGGRAGYAYPSDAYRTIGELAALLHRLPQALEQISLYLGDEHRAGRIVADWGSYATRTEVAVDDAQLALAFARDHLEGAAVALDKAHTATSGLSQAGAA